jgi:hypothetical protein
MLLKRLNVVAADQRKYFIADITAMVTNAF